MMNFKKRSTLLELMDERGHSPEKILPALQEIDQINRWLGGFNQSIHDLHVFSQMGTVTEVQDWGCGSGDLIRKMSQWAKKRGLKVSFIGIDIDPETITYARQRTMDESVEYWCENVLGPALAPSSTDVVSSCLFTHHFTDDQWVELISKMLRVSRVGVIINDLQRHWFAYYSIAFLTRLFARSAMVQYDAPLSVAKGFTRKELIRLLEKSGVAHYKIRWNWAFRWSILLYK